MKAPPLLRGLLTREGALTLRVSPGLVEVDVEGAPEPRSVYRKGTPIGQLLELSDSGMILLADLRAAIVGLQAQEADSRPISWRDQDGTSFTTEHVLAGFDAEDLEMVLVAESVYAVEQHRKNRMKARRSIHPQGGQDESCLRIDSAEPS